MAYKVTKEGEVVINFPTSGGRKSASGKSNILETTGGFKDIGGGVLMSYNFIKRV